MLDSFVIINWSNLAKSQILSVLDISWSFQYLSKPFPWQRPPLVPVQKDGQLYLHRLKVLILKIKIWFENLQDKISLLKIFQFLELNFLCIFSTCTIRDKGFKLLHSFWHFWVLRTFLVVVLYQTKSFFCILLSFLTRVPFNLWIVITFVKIHLFANFELYLKGWERH